MNESSDNFEFILGTSLAKYYNGLKEAEMAYEDYELVTYIELRKVLEGLCIDIFEKSCKKYDLKEKSLWNYLNAIKPIIPNEIYNNLDNMRDIFNKEVHYNELHRRKDYSALKVLSTIYTVILWYLKEYTRERPYYNISFRKPEKNIGITIHLQKSQKEIKILEKNIKKYKKIEKDYDLKLEDLEKTKVNLKKAQDKIKSLENGKKEFLKGSNDTYIIKEKDNFIKELEKQLKEQENIVKKLNNKLEQCKLMEENKYKNLKIIEKLDLDLELEKEEERSLQNRLIKYKELYEEKIKQLRNTNKKLDYALEENKQLNKEKREHVVALEKEKQNLNELRIQLVQSKNKSKELRTINEDLEYELNKYIMEYKKTSEILQYTRAELETSKKIATEIECYKISNEEELKKLIEANEVIKRNEILTKDLTKELEYTKKMITIKTTELNEQIKLNKELKDENNAKASHCKILIKNNKVKHNNTNKYIGRYPYALQGFIYLEDDELKYFYALSNIFNTFNTSTLSVEGIFYKLGKNMNSKINEEIFKIEGISSNEIRLDLYYNIMKIYKQTSGYVWDEDLFKENFDDLVDKTYYNLEKICNFEKSNNKFNDIINYYLFQCLNIIEKIMESNYSYKNDVGDIIFKQINYTFDNEAINVYSNIFSITLPLDEIKETIRLDPINIIKELISSNELVNKNIAIRIIGIAYCWLTLGSSTALDYKILEVFQKELTIKILFDNSNLIKREDFIGAFILNLFLARNFKEIKNEKFIYKEMLDVFIEKSKELQRYYKLKEECEIKRNKFILEKEKLEKEHNQLLIKSENLAYKIEIDEEKFKRQVFGSEFLYELNGYKEFKALINKKNALMIELGESKNSNKGFKGFFFYMKDSLNIKNEVAQIDKKMNLLREELVQVAKNSIYFIKEVETTNINNNRLKEYNKDICKLTIKIEDYIKEIDSLRDQIKELESSIEIINNQYFDISKYNNIYLENDNKIVNVEQA